ncbi:MAG: 5-formyltetrahydrofolate cyclo-ligase [Ruthenibacterium sp.]
MTAEKSAADEKRALRQRCRDVLAQCSAEDTAAASAAICAALCALPQYRAARAVFCFVGTAREIDTSEFLQKVLDDGKILCVPYCVQDSGQRGVMCAKRITALTQLQSGAFGIAAPPQDAPEMQPELLSLAVLPCLAADANGNRLGYGGGYYDRYLARLLPACATAVLCREKLLLPCGVIPVQEHDIPAQTVLTERSITRTGAAGRG